MTKIEAAEIKPPVTAAKVCRACRRQGCDCAEEAARLERESR